MKHNPGIGATPDLSLRVSIATLVRVVFTSDLDRDLLVLERKATYFEREQHMVVKAQPFGGVVRINNPARLYTVAGVFHFDSERSRREQDFRIFIRPAAWDDVKACCLEQFQASDDAVFETSPERELAEELQDSLAVKIEPDRYGCQPFWIVVENNPSPTANIHAETRPTVRIYRVFEAQIVDPALWQQIKLNSDRFSDQDLQDRTLEDLRNGGKGRANGCMILPMDSLCRLYLSLSLDQRNSTISFEKTTLERNVVALLDDITVPQFQYIVP